MSSTTLVIVPTPPRQVPAVALDDAQQRMVELAGRGHLIFRGLPGSGKTTTLLAVVAAIRDAGQSFVFLAPDRQRAARLNEQVRVLVEDDARPVKTPAGFAYGVIERWRNFRADPLGGVELVTGAQEDAQIMQVLQQGPPPQFAAFVGEDGRPSALLRMELRNVMSTAQRLGVTSERLRELGKHYDFPAWVGAADVFAALEDSADRRLDWRGSMRVTHSEIEGIAAGLLASWEESAGDHQVTAPSPLPQVVIVDDLQDMTPATVSLLAVMADSGCRIIAASEPDAAVATFRGALPQADVLLARILGVEISELESCHRGVGQVRSMVRRVSGHVTNVGPGRRRAWESDSSSCQISDSCLSSGNGGTEVSTEVSAKVGAKAGTPQLLVAQTNAQMGAHIARLIRENYLFEQVGWERQAVIVRSQSHARDIQRQLKRFSVPVQTASQAFHFMAEPTTRIMLRLLDGARLDNPEDTDLLVSELISSALIGVDAVDLHRVLRAYGALMHDDGEIPGGQSASVTTVLARLAPATTTHNPAQTKTGAPAELPPVIAADIATVPALAHHQATVLKLADAARVWEAARQSVGLRPRQALWNVWEAAGIAAQWQQRAVGRGQDATWYDTQLDAVVALFRVADIWEQRNPAGTAKEFVEDTISQNIPVDTLGQSAYRPEAVQVLTPMQAAGQEWDVVIVAGVHDGEWPNAALRHHMLHADVLADIVIGSMIGAEEQTWQDMADPRRRRHSVRDDEYRLFVAALSRARTRLCFAVVVNEDSAPSELIERALGVREGDRVEQGIPRDQEGRIRFDVQPAPSPLDQSGVLGDLRYWASAPAEYAERAHLGEQGFAATQEAARQALGLLIHEGIVGAHPNYWQTPGELTTEQRILEGIKPSISPSAVERIETCPLRWFASYAGAESRPIGAATRGTFIHALAEDHHKDPSVSVTDLYHQRWPEYSQGMEPIEKRAEQEKVEACVRGLQAYFDALEPEALRGAKAEEYIQVELDNYTIRGMIDRLEPDGDGWKIVDFKTGKPKTDEEALVDPQLQTYQFALGHMGVTVTGAQLQYVRQGEKRNTPTHVAGQRLQPALSPQEYQERQLKLDQDVTLMNAAVFEARRNPTCDFCSFHPICPAWVGDEGGNE